MSRKHDFGRIWASGGTFSGLSHLVGGVKTSYLVQSGQDTSPDVVKGLEGPRSHISRQYHVRDVPKNTISGSFGPLEASRGLWRPNQTDNSRNQSCVGHVGGVWKQLVGSGGPIGSSKAIQVPKSQRNPLKYSNFQKKNPLHFFFFFFFLEESCRVPQARVTCYAASAQRRRREAQARSTGAQRRRAAPNVCSAAGAVPLSAIAGSKKLVARAQRGSRAFTRRGE